MTWVPRFIPTTSPTCPTDKATLLLCAEDFLLPGSPEHPTYTLLLTPLPARRGGAHCTHFPDEEIEAQRGCSLTTSTKGEAEPQSAPNASALEPT